MNRCFKKKKHNHLTGWPKETIQQLQTITCLPMEWKILTTQIREEKCYTQTSRELFPEEQKGCCKGTRGTAKLLDIDQLILNESNTRRKNLAMAWIYYKKGYDIVPQSWIINCFKMSHEVINILEITRKTWRVEFRAGGRGLAEAKIQRDIFKEMLYHPYYL